MMVKILAKKPPLFNGTIFPMTSEPAGISSLYVGIYTYIHRKHNYMLVFLIFSKY